MRLPGRKPGAHARRDLLIAAARRNGDKVEFLAEIHGLSPGRVSVIAEQQGVVGPRRQGRKRLFANDPNRRADYLALREAMGAAYAREQMGLAA